MKIYFQAPDAFEILPNLWVGGCPTLDTEKGQYIDHLILCAKEYGYDCVCLLKGDPDATHLGFEDKADATDEELSIIPTLADLAIDRLDRGETVAITCLAGRNRSVAVATAVLAKRLRISGEKAIEVVKLVRGGDVLTNPSFVAYLKRTFP